MPESGHKMLLHAQYIIIVSEIFTTQRSLKVKSSESKKNVFLLESIGQVWINCDEQNTLQYNVCLLYMLEKGKK